MSMREVALGYLDAAIAADETTLVLLSAMKGLAAAPCGRNAREKKRGEPCPEAWECATCASYRRRFPLQASYDSVSREHDRAYAEYDRIWWSLPEAERYAIEERKPEPTRAPVQRPLDPAGWGI